MLLLEDPGGEPLDRLLGRPLELREFLRLAIALAGALGKLHAAGLVHKNIKPANILVEPRPPMSGSPDSESLPVFGASGRPLNVLSSLSTLAYMAPEQTGRMNRSIDSRSDLYSYGAISYEMLTGVLPFSVSEPMEWVHAHIARRPIPPRDRVEQIPETVSAIVMKLLAKASEERYQTAEGVEADFRRCLAEFVSSNRIDPFPLGAHDMSDRLLIPERLYGRDRECAALRKAFESGRLQRCAGGGAGVRLLRSRQILGCQRAAEGNRSAARHFHFGEIRSIQTRHPIPEFWAGFPKPGAPDPRQERRGG